VTVAAVILAASVESALADAEGQPRVRRLVDIAWSGGAVPIVVVAPDPDGLVAAALAGAPVTLAEPAPIAGGPVGQIARGLSVAAGLVSETDAALVWPARMVWVGPETVTSLIEAHGPEPDAVLRPSYDGEGGWPVLVPIAQLDSLRAMAPDLMPDAIVEQLSGDVVGSRSLDLGDPGSTHDAGTARADLPAYVGPSEPAGGHTHEWGAAAAEQADDPLEGPSLAPFDGAVDDD
jgi:CTP:molybdopterin cytidylyltransferase MocA